MAKVIYMERTVKLLINEGSKVLNGVVPKKEGVFLKEKYFVV